jgi:quinolinate synthase
VSAHFTTRPHQRHDMDAAAASLLPRAAASSLLPRRVLSPLHVSRSGLLPRQSSFLAARCAHSRAPPPHPPLPRADCDDAAAKAHPRLRLRLLAEEFRALPSDADRARRLLSLAAALPRLPEPDRAQGNRVMGCVARVWLVARCNASTGWRMWFSADSDSDLSRGYCACLVAALDGAKPEDVLAVDPADPDLAPLGAGTTAAWSRASTWHNVLVGMQKRARTAIAAREGRHPGKPFPSLVIARDGAVSAQGSYAEAQVSSFSS